MAAMYVAMAVTLGSFPGWAASTAAPVALASSDDQVVARSGPNLTVGGEPWRFVGYNLPCAQPFVLSDAQLGYYLDSIRYNAGATVIRAWFFQSNGGPGHWEGFDRLVAALKARNMRVVATLTNEFAACEPAPSGQERLLDWYRDGYRQAGDGYPLAFRDFATAVAARYAGDPTVAMWQLINEAEAPSAAPSGRLACDEADATSALRSFADDMTGTLHDVDPRHLVGLGSIGTGQCGLASSSDYRFVHDGALDVCEYHDYASPAEALPLGVAQRLEDCRDLPHGPKPLFIGEAGIAANVQPDGGPGPCSPWPSCTPDAVTADTLAQRATLFQAKVHAAFAAGVTGYLVWVKSPFYDPSTDPFAIGDGDPAQAVLRTALVPGPPLVGMASACNHGAIVSWVGPTGPAGVDVTGYVVTASSGATTTAPAGATNVTFRHLPNLTTYDFTVAAVNAGGTGPPSTPSNPVVPRASAGRCGP